MRILNKQRLEKEIQALYRQFQDDTSETLTEEKFNTALTNILNEQELETDGGVTRNVCVLICDIRGFSQLVENVSTTKVIQLLNVFFGSMVDIIDSRGGQVNKFMGDSLIAFFDSGEDVRGSVLQVLECAIAMQLAMDDVNLKSHELGMDDVYMGIGIDTGEVVASVFGSDIFREFTIIGNPVNIASRIEGYTLRGQILISETTRDYVADVIETGGGNEVNAKGMKDPLCFYELQAVNEPKRVELPRRDNRREQRINIKIPVCYQLLDGKNVLPDVVDGEVVDISYGGMLLNVKDSIEQFSDIKLNMLLTPFSKNPIDLYAKAVYVQANEGGSEVGLEFTIVDNNANAALKFYVDNII